MKKYLDKRITLYLRGIKAIAIYHADEDYYALDLAGVVYSLKTKKDVESKFNEFVDRLIYKETLILKEILTDPDYQRRDFTMLDYFTALINREKAKSERSPESYMWDKVVRVYETKKSRKKIHDIKEQMELIWDEVHIIPKNIKKKELSDIEVGDLVFYGSNIYHVGLYIGDEKIIHASTSASGIKVSDYDFETPSGVGTYLK